MTKIIKASGNEVEPYWPMLFAKALKGQDITKLLSNVGTGGGGGGGAAPATDAGAGGAKEEEKPKEEEPEEDVDMGDLFGGGDDDY